jgi:hypothetical protein
MPHPWPEGGCYAHGDGNHTSSIMYCILKYCIVHKYYSVPVHGSVHKHMAKQHQSFEFDFHWGHIPHCVNCCHIGQQCLLRKWYTVYYGITVL